MSQRHYRSPFGDTTFTKVFVGGLAWETPTDVMRSHFEPFGEILEAVIINDKNTGKSKGYGFVTFRDPESATRACADPNPVIDGRRANCNIASLGRRRPSPPRGRNQVGNLSGGATPYGSVPPLPPPVPPPPPVIYRPYGYSTYPPDFGYHQAIYSSPVQQSHHYNHLYGGSSSSMGSPYFYGYSLHTPRGAFSMPPPQRYHGPSYLYYHTALPDPSAAAYSPLRMQMPTRIPYTSIADSAATPQIQSENEAGPVSSTTTSA